MKWFKHYSNAHDNNDLTKVRMKYGCEGYAIYWYCLELVAADLGTNSDITFELKHDAEVIGFNLRIDTALVEEIMTYMVNIGLFENAHGTITCLKLAKYLDKKTTKNKTIHQIIDAAKASDEEAAKVGDHSGPSEKLPDQSGPFPLDTDTELIKKIKNKKKLSTSGDKSQQTEEISLDRLSNFYVDAELIYLPPPRPENDKPIRLLAERFGVSIRGCARDVAHERVRRKLQALTQANDIHALGGS